ncbi:MAG: hypothetical protein JWP03_477 [Phycisphaerales bacterium]|jgi:REP element-mobilizing transposase RayT|nr:hypothetical protein [Phycisphaerales bacterium]
MPRYGHLWRHVIINTLSTWLHGDERGFRSRKHRIHSSGDYKKPPPAGEHEGLHEFHKERARDEVHIDHEDRATIGRAFAKYLMEHGYRVLAVAVTKVHAHALIEVPHGLNEVKKIVGEAKRASSRAVEATMPGNVWSAGGKYKPVMDRAHCEKTHDYILYEQGAEAWTWSFRDRSMVGIYMRRRPALSRRKP